jgi:hypothetical protein
MGSTNETAMWWYERGGQQLGPVSLAALQQLAATGQLPPSSLVWTTGMPAWARAETVAALSWAAAPPPLATTPLPTQTPPFAMPAPGPSARWAPPGATTAASAVAAPEQMNVPVVILLSIVTLGVYGAVKFFQVGRAYERLAGRETRFALYFWLFIGLALAGFALNAATGYLGIPFGVASLVFQFLTLGQALAARREGLQRWSLVVDTSSDAVHWVLLALGIAFSFLAVGVVFLIAQAAKWFLDWNAIRAAAIARG